MTAPREVIAEARHGYASSPFYRADWGSTRPADPPLLDPAAIVAFAQAHDDAYGGLLAQGLVVGGLFAAYQIEAAGQTLLVAAGDADLAWDRAAARNTLLEIGVTALDRVLVIERVAHAYQHRVWLAAVQDLKARSLSAQPGALDASHCESTVVIGLGNSTWNALPGSISERWATFRCARMFVADHDFAPAPPAAVRVLRRLTVAGMQWVEPEPGGGFVAPADRVYLEVAREGAAENDGPGDLLVTTVQRDACPFVRLRTGLTVHLHRDGALQRFHVLA